MAKLYFVSKFKYAAQGLIYLWQHEKSWRWQVLAAGLVQVMSLVLGLEPIIWALLTLASVAVLCAEAFNTALERLIDIVEPRLSAQVALLKNLLAAAVLIMALGAVAVALIVLF